MNPKQLADELDVEHRLLKHGCTKEECSICKGRGRLAPINDYGNIECQECEGRGFHWKRPLEK